MARLGWLASQLEPARLVRSIKYDLNNVFNADKTALYWELEPSKTLAQGPLSGKKKSKKRVTLLLTCNATGTEKLKPLFIHKYQNS